MHSSQRTGLVAAVLLGAHRVVYGPVYGAAWLTVAASMGLILGRRALDRARRYRVGVSIDDDAFAGAEVDLVRRVGQGYELSLVPGMTGTIASGRAPIAVETLVSSNRTVRLPLGGDVRAEISLGDDHLRRARRRAPPAATSRCRARCSSASRARRSPWCS